jgi:hypothetical protein
MTPSGIEPATFWFVAHDLKYCAIAVPTVIQWMGWKQIFSDFQWVVHIVTTGLYLFNITAKYIENQQRSVSLVSECIKLQKLVRRKRRSYDENCTRLRLSRFEEQRSECVELQKHSDKRIRDNHRSGNAHHKHGCMGGRITIIKKNNFMIWYNQLTYKPEGAKDSKQVTTINLHAW